MYIVFIHTYIYILYIYMYVCIQTHMYLLLFPTIKMTTVLLIILFLPMADCQELSSTVLLTGIVEELS